MPRKRSAQPLQSTELNDESSPQPSQKLKKDAENVEKIVCETIYKASPTKRGAGFYVTPPSDSPPKHSENDNSFQVTPCTLIQKNERTIPTDACSRKRRNPNSPPADKKVKRQESPENSTENTLHLDVSRTKLEGIDKGVEGKNLCNIDIKNGCSPEDPLFSRAVFNLSNHQVQYGKNQLNFSVLTYNILSEHYRKKSDYSYTEECYLDMNYRHKKIMQEIQYLDADVVCLQEVEPEYFKEVLEPEMNRLKYGGHFFKRTHETPEGEATFYKTNDFTICDVHESSYRQLAYQDIDRLDHSEEIKEILRSHLAQFAVLLITRLRHIPTNRQILIGNTHLTFTYFKNVDITTLQMAYAFKEMIRLSDDGGLPFVLCGDFNTRTEDPGYQLAVDGYLNDKSLEILQKLKTVSLPDGSKRSLVDMLWCAFQHPARNVLSSYCHVQGFEPECTSKNEFMDTVVDYLWSSSAIPFSVTSVHKIGEFLPSKTYPSDHVSLKAQYCC